MPFVPELSVINSQNRLKVDGVSLLIDSLKMKMSRHPWQAADNRIPANQIC